ncbi:MAG: pyridoxal-dependent decarboxylase, partial [Calditrichota bacterium]
NGLIPLCVVAACGTTGSTAIDPLEPIGEICKKEKVWFHVDAAYAGTAAMLPEKRWILNGVEHADSYVFNPHKWMFTNFDCTAYYVKDKAALIRTFEILPEYLKTREDSVVNNYRDWGIPLGRRFRALKLWFVIRSFGVEGMQSKLRKHIELADRLKSWIEEHPDFQLLAPVPLNTVCFHYAPKGSSIAVQNKLNAALLEKLNETGKLYLTHTKLNGVYTLRIVIGQTYVDQKHVEEAWLQIRTMSEKV